MQEGAAGVFLSHRALGRGQLPLLFGLSCVTPWQGLPWRKWRDLPNALEPALSSPASPLTTHLQFLGLGVLCPCPAPSLAKDRVHGK